jgi:aminoglycoside phosphotransferase (APT) family kinase protein
VSLPSKPLGIDSDGVSSWCSKHLPEIELPLDFSLIPGGHSNLSYRVEDAAGHRYVLRRPPLSFLMPSAHDVLRESRVMTALRSTPVPVPIVRAECRDENVTGAVFFVMDYVEGAVLREVEEVEQAVDEPERRRLGLRLAETLAHLHDVEPVLVGLGDLGRGTGYMERQLRRWRSQWDGWKTRDIDAVDRVGAWLGRQGHRPGLITIVHGDFRLDNTIIDHAGDVAAVLDWELCTLGDPLADVGVMLAYWVDPGKEPIPHLSSASSLPGFPTRRELAEHYSHVSGRDVSAIDLYLSFAYWKIAIVLEGVYSRYRAGALGEHQESFEDIKVAVDRLAREAEMIGPGAHP